jgi:hypothetical protein
MRCGSALAFCLAYNTLGRKDLSCHFGESRFPNRLRVAAPMSTHLFDLSVLVGVRIVSHDELQDVEIQADLGSRDLATVTLGDAQAAMDKYKIGQPLEIKLRNQTRLFRGRIVNQNLRAKHGGPQMVISGMSEMRPSQTRPPAPFALPRFQNLDQRMESLSFRHLAGYPWRTISKSPVDVWKASLALRWPTESDFAAFPLEKYVEFSAQGKSFQGTIESLEISIHRDARPTRFVLHLIGTLSS